MPAFLLQKRKGTVVSLIPTLENEEKGIWLDQAELIKYILS
jgi:hypothetical protein